MKLRHISRLGKGHGSAIPAQAHLRSKLSGSGQTKVLMGYQV